MHSHIWSGIYKKLTHGWSAPFNTEWWIEYLYSGEDESVVPPRDFDAECAIHYEIDYLIEAGALEARLMHILLFRLCKEAGIPVGKGGREASASYLLHAFGVTKADPSEFPMNHKHHLRTMCRNKEIQFDVPPELMKDVFAVAKASGIFEICPLTWRGKSILVHGDSFSISPTLHYIAPDSRFDFSEIPIIPTNRYQMALIAALQQPKLVELLWPQFLRRVQFNEAPDSPHPLLEGILNRSFGMGLTDDDLVRSIHILSGFHWSAADRFLRILKSKGQDGSVYELFTRALKRRQHLFGAERDKLLEYLEEWGDNSFSLPHWAAIVADARINKTCSKPTAPGLS